MRVDVSTRGLRKATRLYYNGPWQECIVGYVYVRRPNSIALNNGALRHTVAQAGNILVR